MNNPASRVLTAIEQDQTQLPIFAQRLAEIAGKIGGWSGPNHYLFFSSVLNELREVKNILILGVYMGRDIAIMSDSCKRDLMIVGVDKFEDSPCEDWPDKNIKSWTEAGFGTAPSVELAIKNLEARLPANHQFRIIQSDDAVWLENVVGKFDFIYVDTSHDKATVVRQFAQIKKLCHENTLVAGDDYENIVPTWGVKDAVTECTKQHHVLADCIWWCNGRDIK